MNLNHHQSQQLRKSVDWVVGLSFRSSVTDLPDWPVVSRSFLCKRKVPILNYGNIKPLFGMCIASRAFGIPKNIA
jgi:hypothetical protein